MEQKAILIKKYSAIGSESSKELLCYEAINLIKHLEKLSYSANQMRKKLLHYGYLMSYEVPRNEEQKDLAPGKVNFQNVSAWCQSNKCKNPKPLDKYTPDELPEIVSQFEKVYQSFNKAIIK